VSKPATNTSSTTPTQRRTASELDGLQIAKQQIAGRGVASQTAGDVVPNLRVLRVDSARVDSAEQSATAPLHPNAPLQADPSSPLKASHASSDELEMDRLLAVRKQNERRWDDFILGEHNRFAYTGAQMVLERPGSINPLFIHGPHGVGKSHLAQGLAQQLRHQYRMRRVLVLTGEQFTIEYTESARGGGFANFRRKYRDVETLVIDDIQFCLGKAGTLVELRNTIDMLIRDRRQVILVADRGLHEMSGLGSDLYARLSGGMSCSIEPMDIETRQQLLQKQCLKHFVSISDEALEVIAKQCGGDARVLHGIVHRLVAQQRIQGSTLNTDDAIRCTMDLVRASQPIVRLNDIERAVCDAFGLDDEMLRTKTKCQSVSQPRMLAMFLARKYTRTALSEIGEFFGNRQHSTVISAQKKVEQWLTSDDAIQVGRNRVTVREILRSLESNLQVG
jgi:chromosomal replication initiator protein